MISQCDLLTWLQLFGSYSVPREGHMFGLPFRSLMDVLQVRNPVRRVSGMVIILS